MSIGRVVVTWGDAERVFDLQPMRWLRELQTKTQTGPFKLLTKLKSGDWYVDDVRHIIRTGLLGGGMKDIEANELMATQFDNRPIMESIPLAIAILGVGLYGGSEPTKKAEAEADSLATTDASPSRNFTAAEPS